MPGRNRALQYLAQQRVAQFRRDAGAGAAEDNVLGRDPGEAAAIVGAVDPNRFRHRQG